MSIQFASSEGREERDKGGKPALLIQLLLVGTSYLGFLGIQKMFGINCVVIVALLLQMFVSDSKMAAKGCQTNVPVYS